MLKRLLIASLAAAAFAMPTVGHAEFPEKTITVIVPSTPGSQPSIVAQVITEAMQDVLGQSVIVVNRPGANQMIGNDAVVRSEPDGYTIGQASGSIANLNAFVKAPPFDPKTDVKMLGSTALTKLVLATGPTAPFPPNVPPEATLTLLPLMLPLTRSLPAFTFVGPT